MADIALFYRLQKNNSKIVAHVPAGTARRPDLSEIHFEAGDTGETNTQPAQEAAMTNKALTLAALMLASTTLVSTAEAGGIRLSFGGPLGSFTAHPNQSSGPGGTARNEHCAKPEARHYAKPSYVGRQHQEEEAPVRHVKRATPKVEVAETPAPRKVKKQPKIEVAEETPAPRKIRKPKVVIEKPEVTEQVEVQTAKLDDKSVISDVTPSIYVPETPVAAAEFTGTQSTPAVVLTAALTPAPEVAIVAKDAKKEEAAKPVKAEKSDTTAAKICRRFSAVIAGLIEIPCGN
jgi:hypothetical protein